MSIGNTSFIKKYVYNNYTQLYKDKSLLYINNIYICVYICIYIYVSHIHPVMKTNKYTYICIDLLMLFRHLPKIFRISTPVLRWLSSIIFLMTYGCAGAYAIYIYVVVCFLWIYIYNEYIYIYIYLLMILFRLLTYIYIYT